MGRPWGRCWGAACRTWAAKQSASPASRCKRGCAAWSPRGPSCRCCARRLGPHRGWWCRGSARPRIPPTTRRAPSRPRTPCARGRPVELLRRHLRTANGRSLAVMTLREVEPGKGFVELDRRYVVPGTADERREAVFLGFHRAGNRWVLSELRTTP